MDLWALVAACGSDGLGDVVKFGGYTVPRTKTCPSNTPMIERERGS